MTQILRLPWDTLPITANQAANMHRQVRAKKTREIRNTVGTVAWLGLRDGKIHREPGQVIVTTVWQVTDKRVRDTGAATVLAKAAIDGLVDAGVIKADHWWLVVEERYRIELGSEPALRMEIMAVAGVS